MLNFNSQNINLTFDESRGAFSSLIIGERECIFGSTPLFNLRLRDKEGVSYLVNASDMIYVNVEKNIITYKHVESTSIPLTVKIQIKENDGLEFYVSVLSIPKDLCLEWIEVPKIVLPRLIENNENGGKILFPYNEGMIVTNEELLPRYEPEFPSSGAYFTFPNMVCSQFMAYLFDDIGLYIGAHDRERALKCVDFYAYENGLSLQMRLWSGVGYGENFCTDYPIVLKACQGNWKSAAKIYRDWFEKNLPQNLIPINKNKSLPSWYEKTPLIVTYPVRGIHDMDKMEPNALFPYTNALPILKKIKNDTGCQIMALLMHWEGTAPWAPPYVWPPYGGEKLFYEFRDALHENGDLLGVYCSGFGYTLKSTLIEEYQCEEKIKNENVLEGVCHSPENRAELGRTCTPYQRYGYDICPASRRGKEILNEGFSPLFESGIDYAQILDQNHGGGQYLCYAREHNHPPMPGKWMTSNMQELLSEWNQKAPNMLFGCESASAEPFIGNLLMSDNRFELNYPFGKPVPLYAFLYHEYVRNFMGNQCGCPFDTKFDTLRYRLAYSFSIGDIMTLVIAPNGDLMTHWGTHDFEHSPNKEKTMCFIKNVMNFYNDKGKKYLHCGKMSSCDDITCDEIKIPLLRGQKYSTLPRLLCSAWEEENGKTAFIVVNPEETEVSFKIGNDNFLCPPLDACLIIK